jgi:hypothetical protein
MGADLHRPQPDQAARCPPRLTRHPPQPRPAPPCLSLPLGHHSNQRHSATIYSDRLLGKQAPSVPAESFTAVSSPGYRRWLWAGEGLRYGWVQAMNVRYRWLQAPDLNLHRQPARAMIFRKPSRLRHRLGWLAPLAMRLPTVRALDPCSCRPASTRSWTIARSKSAKTPLAGTNRVFDPRELYGDAEGCPRCAPEVSSEEDQRNREKGRQRHCGPVRTELTRGAPPACCLGFLLGAEPAFAGALIDLRAAIERVAGQVVDALA